MILVLEKFSRPPKPADILLCTDVLEHVEPEKTEEVLRHIKSLTLNVATSLIYCQQPNGFQTGEMLT